MFAGKLFMAFLVVMQRRHLWQMSFDMEEIGGFLSHRGTPKSSVMRFSIILGETCELHPIIFFQWCHFSPSFALPGEMA